MSDEKGFYNNVLVAADQSASSQNALRETISFAKRHSVGVTVVSVSPPHDGAIDMTWMSGLDDTRKPYVSTIEKAGALAKEAGVDIQSVLLEGEPYTEIVDYAHGHDCDLIVMGRRGLTRLQRALMGSVTSRVIGYSMVDVLTVPRESKIGFGKIVLAVDGSKCSNNATKRAIQVAKSYGGELTIVSSVESANARDTRAWDAARGYVADAKNTATAAGVNADGLTLKGKAYDVISCFTKDYGADIVVVGSHGRTGLMRLIMGSVTEKIIGHAHCPVLVVR